mgnify:CR=1 FL=1
MNALNAFTVTIVNLFLVAYSDTSIAFFGAYFKIQQLIIMTINGLIQGCLPIMIQIFRQMFFLIPIMWILEKALLINGIWIVFPVTELLAFVAAVILFMRLRIQNNNKDIVGYINTTYYLLYLNIPIKLVDISHINNVKNIYKKIGNQHKITFFEKINI